MLRAIVDIFFFVRFIGVAPAKRGIAGFSICYWIITEVCIRSSTDNALLPTISGGPAAARETSPFSFAAAKVKMSYSSATVRAIQHRFLLFHSIRILFYSSVLVTRLVIVSETLRPVASYLIVRLRIGMVSSAP